MLSQRALKEFKDLWKLEYGEDISDDFAVEIAMPFLNGMSAAYRPIEKEWLSVLHSEHKHDHEAHQQ